MLKILVIGFIVVLAFLFLRDAKKKSPIEEQDPVSPEDVITADEAMPTQTGRYRVQQMFQKMKAPETVAASQKTAETKDSAAETLPDPFDQKDRK